MGNIIEQKICGKYLHHYGIHIAKAHIFMYFKFKYLPINLRDNYRVSSLAIWRTEGG